ncbi:hypothetical protein [Bacillus sp. es.034]|uniref:hypothetical protein n=1 Tax=Bacillus sp. es.034 TaxID=1761763 RepID=UPI000BFA79A0|nr:hypothetical protein [Bacillus sp. es.034]PFG04657.1 hypothetical protein ATG71_1448 [Bacillus sp. es.034]
MQINPELKVSSHIPSDHRTVLKEGDVYHALVKERLPGNEAVLQIKGQEVKVKFEGEVPLQNRIAVVVNDTKESVIGVKSIPLPAELLRKEKIDTSTLLRNLPANEQTKSAVNLLLQKGVPIDKETLQAIKAFMDLQNGTVQQKLETLSMMVKKDLKMSEIQLKSVHEAMHSKSFAQSLQSLLKDIDPEFGKDPANHRRTAEVKNQAPISEAKSQLLKKAAFQRVQEAILLIEKNVKHQPEKVQALQAIKAELTETGKVEAAVQKIRDAFPSEVRQVPGVTSKLSDAVKLVQSIRVIESTPGLSGSEGEVPEPSSKPALETMPPKTTVGVQSPDIEKLGQVLLEGQTKNEMKTQSVLLDAVSKAVTSVKKEADFRQVLKQISSLSSGEVSLSPEHKRVLDASLSHAETLEESGKELKARQELLHSLTRIHQETMSKNESKPSASFIGDTYHIQEELLSSLPVQSKNLMVERISKKLSQVAIDFKHVKNDLTKGLHMVEQLIQQHKSRAVVSAKPLLEATIKKLDQAILRSDVMLYADMKTEKKLLTASTQLAEAKKLLAKGAYAEANKIVSSIKSDVDKLIFKPSDVRVKHYVSEEMNKLEQLPMIKRGAQQIEHAMQALKQEPTARNSFEYMRTLGITHDADHAHHLVSPDKTREPLPTSLKDMLMKLSHHEDGQTASKAEGLLSNVTGQQLLSKNDSNGLQNLMFTLPLLLQDKLENIKVFVNSKNDQQKIDWENCSLYFLFETKKLGEVGIALTSSDRTLSIKVKNDMEGFKERMEPISLLAKERLEKIGYIIGKIQFTPLHKKEHALSESLSERKQPAITEKGYDFSI